MCVSFCFFFKIYYVKVLHTLPIFGLLYRGPSVTPEVYPVDMGTVLVPVSPPRTGTLLPLPTKPSQSSQPLGTLESCLDDETNVRSAHPSLSCCGSKKGLTVTVSSHGRWSLLRSTVRRPSVPTLTILSGSWKYGCSGVPKVDLVGFGLKNLHKTQNFGLAIFSLTFTLSYKIL